MSLTTPPPAFPLTYYSAQDDSKDVKLFKMECCSTVVKPSDQIRDSMLTAANGHFACMAMGMLENRKKDCVTVLAVQLKQLWAH